MKELTDTEQKIVDAAATEFLEKGIAGARTQTIADKAGINKALLHYYFRSKEKLYEIVAERVIRRAFSQILGTMNETGDFESWLRQFVHNYLVIVAGNPLIPRFMLWEIEAGGARVAFIIKEILNMNSIEDNPLFQIVNKAIKDKQIRPVDPVHLIISMIAMCIAPFIARPVLEKIIPGLNVRTDEFVMQREEAVVDLIWNGVKLETCSNDKNDENSMDSLCPTGSKGSRQGTRCDRNDCNEKLTNGWLFW